MVRIPDWAQSSNHTKRVPATGGRKSKKENHHDISHRKSLESDSQHFPDDKQYVPAGSYKVALLSDRFLSLRNIATNQTQVLMVRPEAGQAIETRGRMVFQQDGSRKYLAQVWIAGTSLHSEMAVQHKMESESAMSKTTTVELALK